MRRFIYLLIFASIVSCSEKKNSEQTSEAEAGESSEELVLSKEQIELAKISTSKLEKRMISETIKCTGSIEVLPQNIASVSPLINGFVKTINYSPGSYVEKGAVLATLNHPDFITLQQNYIEAKSQAEYYEQEYKRQGELTVENAASIKKMQQAKSDYLSSEAIYKSLKSQIKLLGINTDVIEKGDFATEFKLISPIEGRVSQLNANLGKHISPDEVVFEIINESELYLNLTIFEKDIRKVKSGQRIAFHLLNDDQVYDSRVSRIGVKVNENNRTTSVQGVLKNSNRELKPGMHVVASLFISEKEVFAIPTEAIVETENKSYVFIQDNEQFKMMEVELGHEQEQFTEIKNVNVALQDAKIVTKGTYYLISLYESGM
jgi:cobalt-zinc-cadmium efflux system membrane fusion protein